MRPTGPFGFPRITDIGPFSDYEANQEYERVVAVREEPYQNWLPHTEFKMLEDIQGGQFTAVDARFEKVFDLDEPEDFAERIKRGTIPSSTNVAKMSYWIHKGTGTAAIIDINVEEDFRRIGIATTMKERELDYMESEGVDVVYTYVISDGGYKLARRTGFRPITESSELMSKIQEKELTNLEFNSSMNRGAMFRYL